MEKTEQDKPDGKQKAVTIRSFSFIDLANNFHEIEKQMSELGEDASEDYLQLHEMAKNLLAGKLDEVWKLKKAIESHNDALESQLAKKTMRCLSRLTILLSKRSCKALKSVLRV